VKKILIVLVSLAVILWSIWFVFPETSIRTIIEDSLSREFDPQLTGIKKGFFYYVHIDNLRLRRSGKELISLNDIDAHVNPLSLMLLRLNLTMDGRISGGTISGKMDLSKGDMRMRLDLKDADISQISLFRLAGIQGKGVISGRFIMTDDTGHIEFFTDKAVFEPFIFSETNVPLNLFNGIKGAIDIRGNILNITSIALEGRDIYARVKGVIHDAVMDLNMELMPGRSFIENPFFLAGLEKYKISPGYYMIHVRGNLPL
jgi:type II secretion system protein N